MSVWVTVPSKRPPAEVEKWAQAWHAQGYKIALWIDSEDAYPRDLNIADRWMVDAGDGYPGYAVVTNRLIAAVFREDPEARWCVIGGDDVFPDTTKRADEIARECEAYFAEKQQNLNAATFGVMQPTGNRWGESAQSIDQYGPECAAYIDRICGSAFLGREFCLRINGGRGPLWPEFFHMHVDEALFCVTEKLGILWQRRDLTHDHRHWANKPNATHDDCPEFLRKVNTKEHWAESLAILNRLKAEGFKEYLEMAP